MKFWILSLWIGASSASAWTGGVSQVESARVDALISACSNYSGKWLGTCSVGSNENHSETMSIRQPDCEGIYINDQEYPIGGTREVKTERPFERNIERTEFRWHPDRRVLVGNFELKSWNTTGTEYLASDIRFSGTFNLEFEKLTWNGEGVVIELSEEGEVSRSPIKTSCEFVRQN